MLEDREIVFFVISNVKNFFWGIEFDIFVIGLLIDVD